MYGRIFDTLKPLYYWSSVHPCSMCQRCVHTLWVSWILTQLRRWKAYPEVLPDTDIIKPKAGGVPLLVVMRAHVHVLLVVKPKAGGFSNLPYLGCCQRMMKTYCQRVFTSNCRSGMFRGWILILPYPVSPCGFWQYTPLQDHGCHSRSHLHHGAGSTPDDEATEQHPLLHRWKRFRYRQIHPFGETFLRANRLFGEAFIAQIVRLKMSFTRKFKQAFSNDTFKLRSNDNRQAAKQR